MNSIKFAYPYSKLHNQKSGFLVWVTEVFIGDNFPKESYLYDTDGKYKLERNQIYLQLIFLGDKEIPFTTYRKVNEENKRKYVNHIGEIFSFEIENSTT